MWGDQNYPHGSYEPNFVKSFPSRNSDGLDGRTQPRSKGQCGSKMELARCGYVDMLVGQTRISVERPAVEAAETSQHAEARSREQ